MTEKREKDVYGGPVIQDPQERENKVLRMFDMFEELFSMGWRDDAKIHEKENFFEMLEGYAEGIPEEEIWEAWDSFIENTEDELRQCYSKERVEAMMAGDDEAVAEIDARENYRKWVCKRKNSPFPLENGKTITIKILYPTGCTYENGEYEIGKIEEHEIRSADDFYNIVTSISPLTNFFITDAHGNYMDDILPQYCDEF